MPCSHYAASVGVRHRVEIASKIVEITDAPVAAQRDTAAALLWWWRPSPCCRSRIFDGRSPFISDFSTGPRSVFFDRRRGTCEDGLPSDARNDLRGGCATAKRFITVYIVRGETRNRLRTTVINCLNVAPARRADVYFPAMRDFWRSLINTVLSFCSYRSQKAFNWCGDN